MKVRLLILLQFFVIDLILLWSTNGQQLVFTLQPLPIYYIHQSNPLVIQCESTGTSIAYRKDGQDVDITINNSTYTINTPIEGVTASREGIPYDCVASIPPTNAIVSSIGLVIYSYVNIENLTGSTEFDVPNTVLTYIPCDYFIDALPRPQFAWLKDGIEIVDPMILPESGTLLLQAFSDKIGDYTCVITNAYGSSIRLQSSHNYSIISNNGNSNLVLGAHYWPNTENVVFVAGETRYFECVGQFEQCSFAKLDSIGGNLMSLNDTLFGIALNLITIPQVTLAHSGVYRILARGMTLIEFTLMIETPPSIISSTIEGTQIEYERINVTLSCTVTGVPAPNVEWYRNRVALSSSNLITTNEGDYTRVELHINSLQPSDGGYYTCRASNRRGSVVSHGLLSVRVGVAPSLVQGPTPPSYTNISNSGQNLTITCGATGDPVPPTLWWSGPDNIVINASASYYLPTPVISGQQVTFSLVIIHADGLHNGDYYCHASNFKGTVSSVSATSVMIPRYPEIITYFPNTTQNFVQGDTLLINCTAIGIPIPTISWLISGTPLVNSTSFALFQNGSIFVSTKSQESTSIVCRATNALGYVEQMYQLGIQRCPTINNVNIGSQSSLDHFNISVTCNGDGIPVPTIQWLYAQNGLDYIAIDNNTLPYVTVARINELNSGNDLSLDMVLITEENAGYYCCNGTSTNSICNSDTVQKCFQAIYREPPNNLILGTFQLWVFVVLIAIGILLIVGILLFFGVSIYALVRYFKKDTYDIRKAIHLSVPVKHQVKRDRDSDDDGEFDPTYESLPVNKPIQPPSYKEAPMYYGGVTNLPTYSPPPNPDYINTHHDGGLMHQMAYPLHLDQDVQMMSDMYSHPPSDGYSYELMNPEMYPSQFMGPYMTVHEHMQDEFTSNEAQFV